jgi:hypothetical protein
VAWIVEKIVNNSDDEWVRLLFHQSDLFQQCLLLFLLKKIKCDIWPFKSESLLIILPDDFEDIREATSPNQMILVKLIGVGVLALFIPKMGWWAMITYVFSIFIS